LIRLCELDHSHVQSLVTASDGSAVFGESAYDPVVLWGWIEAALKFAEVSKGSSTTSLDLSDIRWPSNSIDDFSLFYGINNGSNHFHGDSESVLHTVIIDIELEKPIGMISILQNNPKHLSARLGKDFVFEYFFCLYYYTSGIHIYRKYLDNTEISRQEASIRSGVFDL